MQEKLSPPVIIAVAAAALVVLALIGYLVFRPAAPAGGSRPMPPSAQARARQAEQGNGRP